MTKQKPTHKKHPASKKSKKTSHRGGIKGEPSNRKLSKKAGLPPGTPVYTGEVHGPVTYLTQITYSSDSWDEWKESVRNNPSAQDLEALRAKLHSNTIGSEKSVNHPPKVTWLHIVGMHQLEIFTLLSQVYSIHPLVLEDILHVHQPPKGELTAHGYFMITGLWSLKQGTSFHDQEHPCQISVLLIDNTIITIAEDQVSELTVLQERIKTARGIIRNQSPAYCMYAIIDTILDSYFHICDQVELELDDIESNLESSDFSQQRIQQFRSQLGKVRRYLLSFREAIQSMSRELSITNPEIQAYLRDLQDHSYHVLNLFENYRETITSLHDLYLSLLSQKMNNIMKVLTIISTIFLPLTFLAGVYGMNFVYMPELERPWAYPLILGLMGMIAIGMLYFFKKKKWL